MNTPTIDTFDSLMSALNDKAEDLALMMLARHEHVDNCQCENCKTARSFLSLLP